MKEKLIIALDVENYNAARNLILQLPEADFFKVGLQAFMGFGSRLLSFLKTQNKKIFLDLKFKDIPNTVYGAVKACLDYKPDFLTIHLSGGADMIKKAMESSDSLPGLTVLGVTVLTSFSDLDLKETGINLSMEKEVIQLCELGIKNGIKGLVCSPLEIEPIRNKFGNAPILVTPGIRPAWSATGDQKRFFTPRMAIEKGSDYLVIGRPVVQNKDPHAAFLKILEEIET
jgi:orotidine-5'-phosphate decarboxylase